MKDGYLGDYFGKNVELVDIDGKLWIGRVADYEPAIDRDEDEPQEDSIALELNPADRSLIGFSLSEIKSIKIIE